MSIGIAAGSAFAEGESLPVDPAKLDAAKRVFNGKAEGVLAKGGPGFSVAWIVDGVTVHAAGYGLADRNDPAKLATKDTIYRAGSISKLFNAIAAMQLVEKGLFDLDAPIQKALPEFEIVHPFPDAGPITIRQLLCHRSGMIREAPVGGYLDPREPSIAETVRSVADCVLVNPPNSRTRYSNVGPTIVGRAIEVVSGQSFEEYQVEHVLAPLGMTSSVWRMTKELEPRLADGILTVATGPESFREQSAPRFELGTIPAGNLYTTAEDLAKFAAFLMSDEPTPAIVSRKTLDEMITPQLLDSDVGFGIGFSIGNYKYHTTIGHGGAVYGFSTSLVVLPKEKIGVVVLCNGDLTTGPVRKLVEASLEQLLKVVHGEWFPTEPLPFELSAKELQKLAGEYESESLHARLEVDGACLTGNLSSQPFTLTPLSPLKFLANGRLFHEILIDFEQEEGGEIVGFAAMNQRFRKVDPSNLPTVPKEWNRFTGAYGPDFIPLIIFIRNGSLYCLLENEYAYRLKPINRVTFQLPPGMYDEEHVVFQTSPDGKVLGVAFANMVLPKQ